jgi:hypothetical protein
MMISPEVAVMLWAAVVFICFFIVFIIVLCGRQ